MNGLTPPERSDPFTAATDGEGMPTEREWLEVGPGKGSHAASREARAADVPVPHAATGSPNSPAASELGAEDERLQREIWERQCPVLLAERDRLRAGLDELLDVATRKISGDTHLDPERWYAARDYARKLLADAG